MRNVACTLVALSAGLLVSGCIITTDDDPQGFVNFAWTFDTATAGGACADGASAVVAHYTGPGTFTDTFSTCEAGTGIGLGLPLGTYTVGLDAVDSGGNLIGAACGADTPLACPVITLELDGDEVPLAFEIVTDGGYFGLGWDLEDATTGAPLTCETAAAAGVTVLTTAVGGGGGGDDYLLPCDEGAGSTTEKVPVDDYTLVISVVDDSEPALAIGPQYIVDCGGTTVTCSIDFGNHLQDLGTFQLEVD